MEEYNNGSVMAGARGDPYPEVSVITGATGAPYPVLPELNW